MPHPIPSWETRPVDELRQQLEIERELAARIRAASDRRGLYSRIYDEFLDRVPHYKHAEPSAELVALQLRLLEPYLTPSTRFLEVGGADFALTIELSKRLPRVIAIEAASTDVKGIEVIVSDTPPYPLPDACVDLAFSSHVIEHLLPADALLHLKEMRRVLARGGRYICVTPNRLWGPHDVSRYFSDEPEGLHLREYTHNDLLALMEEAGFASARIIPKLGEKDSFGASLAIRTLEATLATMPIGLRRRALDYFSRGRSAPLRFIEQVMVRAIA
jgi:SAM-dependent methyltransferase